MTGPSRIQMTRQTPWRVEHPDAVVVDRSTMWGNPILMSDVAGQYPSLDRQGVAGMVVANFRDLVRVGRISLPNWRFASGERGPVTWTYPSLAEIRTQLRGRDLACWCPLDQPCHGDVLLEIANPTPSDARLVRCVTPGCKESTDPDVSNLCESHRREVFGPRP